MILRCLYFIDIKLLSFANVERKYKESFEQALIILFAKILWCARRDSNPEPSDP